ncbi:MAG: methyltransferase domain-containing protein [Candidatus Aegiribacteria sp.]|nr:methyltransferase domain-containing protein [Candidatus Aegiribacteria sp.]
MKKGSGRGGFQYWEDRAYRFTENQRFITGEDTENRIDNWLSDKFKGNEHVLDLGCGTGRYTGIIASMVGRVVAADRSSSMIEQARKVTESSENVTVQMEDCYITSFSDESFDCVFLGNLLHIVAEPEKVMLEVSRIIRPGGSVITVDYTDQGMRLAAKLKMIVRYIKVWGLPPGTGHSLGTEEMTVLAESAGFHVHESILMGQDTKVACMMARKSS